MALGILPLATQVLGVTESINLVTVESDLTIEWAVLVYVSRRLRIRWDTLIFVWSDLIVEWNTNYLPHKDLTVLWNSETTIDKDLFLSWTIFGDQNLIIGKNRVCRPRADRKIDFCG